MEAQADVEILERFPILASGPGITKEDLVVRKPVDSSIATTTTNEKLKAEPEKQKKEELSPWRLVRGIAPPANPQRDLVFLGMMSSFQTMLRSEVAALWAYAYLNNHLGSLVGLSTRPSPPASMGQANDAKVWSGTENEWLYEAALLSRFGRWRYPMGYGARFPDFVFDGMAYFDMLMQDLGLRKWRKGWGWLGEVFGGAYMRGDYKGFVEEWKTKEAMIRDG